MSTNIHASCFPYYDTYPYEASLDDDDEHSDSEAFFCTTLEPDLPDQSGRSEANFEPTSSAVRLGVLNRYKWPNGSTLTVCFLNGSPYLQNRVKEIALEWTRYANIKFQFINGRRAQIRITFTGAGGTSSSFVGSYNLSISPYEETMKLGIVDSSHDSHIRRTVLHEFGHALGCVHEHSQPNFPLTWNEQVVINWHRGIWDEQTVRQNIFAKYSHYEVQASSFDRESIMLYSFPPSWTREGYSMPQNSRLSRKDQEFISAMYPSVTHPTRPPPTRPPPTRPPPTRPPPRPVVPKTSNICGNPLCGQTFICAADYNRVVRPQGYPGV